jgi:hypothetical protein
VATVDPISSQAEALGMQLAGFSGPDRAPGLEEVLAWLGSTFLLLIEPPPGLVSFGMADINGSPSFAEVSYLRGTDLGLRLVSSVWNWAGEVPDVLSALEFDRLIEHYMSTYLTLHPQTPPDEYREPKFEDAREHQIVVAGATFPALFIDGPGEIRGFLASVEERVVTCVWDSDHSEEPVLTRSEG